MFILKKGHQPGVYVPLRALFLVGHAISVNNTSYCLLIESKSTSILHIIY